LLNKQANDALATGDIRKRIADMGGVAPGGSPGDFAKYIGDEIRKWTDVVAFAGIKVE
jgi:tripartite-type tricarboxylate transporter receptor subunit TctC